MGRLHGTLNHLHWRIQCFAECFPRSRIDHSNTLPFREYPLTVNKAAMTTADECSHLRQNFNVAHNSPFVQTICSASKPAVQCCSLRKHTTACRSSAEASPM